MESSLCDKIVHDWKNDNRFETQREMQTYNNGVAEAMDLIKEMLDGDEFKSPFKNYMRDYGNRIKDY